MNKDEVTRLLKKNYKVLEIEYCVSRIGLFGSIANNTMTEDSDLGFVVEFKRPIGFKFNRLVEYLENLFGKEVDVLTNDGIDNIRIKEVATSIKRDLIYV